MEISKVERRKIISGLKKLGLLNEDGMPVSYSRFKNTASIHRYGTGQQCKKIVFAGIPKKNLFGFYPPFIESDALAMKDAYGMYVRLINDQVDEDDEIEWGNDGIPIVYGGLRVIYE